MFDYDPENGEIYLYDDIGPRVFGMIDAEAVKVALDSMGGRRVTVRINSPGGSVDEGVAIFNMLKRYRGGVDTVVDSLAASMASYLMLAGDKRAIARNARVMVHAPWTVAIGNSADLRKTADILDTYTKSIAGEYGRAMSLDETGVSEVMAAETWYTAEEAIGAKLAHKIDGEAVEPVAIAEGRFKNVPKDLLVAAKAGTRVQYPKSRERARAYLR